ncbi:hypothetical protein ACFSTH_15090 [Paenibacillus yanchengensis]|uniref:Uncharacterized protein n=1 Tax=Paenibacillus yanchengensis TaxID=2035833 RepID=A0ABW4YGZ1_9BACL
MMNTRYRITRNPHDEQEKEVISLEECKLFFAKQADFSYVKQYSVRSNETVMTITGEFFLWSVLNTSIPFRYFEGDVYVAVSHELIYNKMLEVAQGLKATYLEG